MALTQRILGRAKRLAGQATGNRGLERRGRRQEKRAVRKARRHKRVAKLAAIGGAIALARKDRPKRVRRAKRAAPETEPPARLVRRTVTTVDTYQELPEESDGR